MAVHGPALRYHVSISDDLSRSRWNLWQLQSRLTREWMPIVSSPIADRKQIRVFDQWKRSLNERNRGTTTQVMWSHHISGVPSDKQWAGRRERAGNASSAALILNYLLLSEGVDGLCLEERKEKSLLWTHSLAEIVRSRESLIHLRVAGRRAPPVKCVIEQ